MKVCLKWRNSINFIAAAQSIPSFLNELLFLMGNSKKRRELKSFAAQGNSPTIQFHQINFNLIWFELNVLLFHWWFDWMRWIGAVAFGGVMGRNAPNGSAKESRPAQPIHQFQLNKNKNNERSWLNEELNEINKWSTKQPRCAASSSIKQLFLSFNQLLWLKGRIDWLVVFFFHNNEIHELANGIDLLICFVFDWLAWWEELVGYGWGPALYREEIPFHLISSNYISFFLLIHQTSPRQESQPSYSFLYQTTIFLSFSNNEGSGLPAGGGAHNQQLRN